MGCSIQRCWDKLHMSAISIHPCKNFLLNNKHLAWAVLFKDAEISCPCLQSAFTHAKIPLHAEHGGCTCAEINTAVSDNLCSGVNLLEFTRPCSSGSSFSILPDPFNHLIIWQYKLTYLKLPKSVFAFQLSVQLIFTVRVQGVAVFALFLRLWAS